MARPLFVDNLDAAIDRLLAELPGDIILGIPLGIGKPNPFVNALYRRIKSEPQRRLRILTALSLEKPSGKSELERHFLKPFVARVFEDYPDLDYVKDSRAGQLPPNIEVLEFFLKSGDYLDNAAAQQSYISTNYTFVARDLALHGVNVVAQAVAAIESEGIYRLSLSSNTDVTAELVEQLAKLPNHRFFCVGVINRQLPFMPNAAEVAPDFFDIVITDPAATHALFAPPNMKISLHDYAIGLHAASLIPDAGTLQIGIGALGDAIAQSLILRQRNNADYRQILSALDVDAKGRELEPFQRGLYGCSEMLNNGLLKLAEAGIVKREVFSDVALQRLLNQQSIGLRIDADMLRKLRAVDRISSPLTALDVDFLRHFGILKPGVTYEGGALWWRAQRYEAQIDDDAALQKIAADLLGDQLVGGVFLHGGFFLGPRDFYEALRTMPKQTLDKIEMNRIDFINQLGGHFALAEAQRQNARFMNTIMMVTLLGAAVSDGLESGQVVSGVGGQYNFVAMAHALPDARSVLLMRATRERHGQLTSNIVWQYGHATIPRHLRDLVITEYGVADLRAQTDSEVIKRLLAITDSRFQDELIATAKKHGKLAADFALPDAQKQNLPALLETALAPYRAQLPDFPFGTDFTADELAMLGALQRLQHAAENPLELATLALRSLFRDQHVPKQYLERLGLDEVSGLRQSLMRRLFMGSL
jgi:acyl-CoA hydrolase